MPAMDPKAKPFVPKGYGIFNASGITSDSEKQNHRTTQTMSSTRCRLLELPAELRNKIWTYASIGQSDVRQSALTRTCRQIRGESLPIFYATSNFVIENFQNYFGKWKKFRAITGQYIILIRHLEFQAQIRGHFMYGVVREDPLSVKIDIDDRGVIKWAVVADSFTWKCSVVLAELLHSRLRGCIRTRRETELQENGSVGMNAKDWNYIFIEMKRTVENYEEGLLDLGNRKGYYSADPIGTNTQRSPLWIHNI